MLMLIYSVVIILSSFMPCFINSLPAEYNKESNNYNNINNNNNTNKVGILIESQEHLIDKKISSVDNNWHNNNNNNTYGINLDNDDDDDDDNNNNNPIRYQHQWLNYEGNQYQTEAAAAAVNFPLAVHKQGNLKTSTDYSTDSNYQDSVHVTDIITPSIPVDEALLLFENFGDKIIKNDDHSNYYENDTGKVEESQNYYFSTELPIENNKDKTIRVSSENYKNALANFKSQLIKNSRVSLNNRKHVTTLTTTSAANKNNVLPELSRLTFQNFNDSLTDIISENEQTKVTANQKVLIKFNTEEPIVVSETGIMIDKNYEYDTARPPCNNENENTEVVESQLLSLATIPPSSEKEEEEEEEEKQLTKSSTDEGTTDYNTPVHSIHSVHSVNSPLFTRELSNRDQDTTSPVVLNSIQAGLALVNADKTHFIGNKVEPLNQFKLNGYSDNYPFENINTSNKNNKNVKSIESPATKNVTLASINHDNDSNNYNDNGKLVEIQKSVELYNSAPIHEIHYPPELSINHPAPPISSVSPVSSASSASSDFVYITSHQDNNHQKNQMSYTDTDISDSNTDFSLKFLSIINQTTPSSSSSSEQQPINSNNNIVFDIEKQKIIEINKNNNNFTNKNNIVGEIYETQDQMSSSSEFLEYKNKQVVKDINGKNLLIDRESDNVSRYINSNNSTIKSHMYYNNNNNNINDFKREGYSNLIEKDKIADATDNSEQTVYIYSPPVVSGGYGSIDISNYNINLPINSEIVEQSNYPVDKLVDGVLDITTDSRYSQPYYFNNNNNNNNNSNRVVEKYQKLKLKPKPKPKQKHVPVIQAYPVTVEKMSKNKVPSPHQPTKTITSTSNTRSYIQKFVSQPYPIHILEQLPYQVDKVIEMPIQIPSYHPLGEIPPRLLSSSSSLLSSIRFDKLTNNNNPNYYNQINNPSIQSNGLLYPTRQQQIKSEQDQSFTNSSTLNLKDYTIGKQAVMPLVVAMRSPLSKRYSLLSQFGLIKHQQNQQQQQQHIFNYYPSGYFKKQLYNNNNDLLKQLPISMHHPKSVVDQTSFQWHVIHPSEKQKITKIEYVGPVPSLTPHHVLNLHQNQVPHPAHQESLHYSGATDTSSSSSSSSSSTLPASSFFERLRLPEIHYYGKVGNFRQSKMEYGFKPPMVPSIQYDEETATKVDNH